MIAWRNPAALVGLLTLAAPLVIHLLRRQRARRVPFPSLRFVRPATAAAVRFRAPSDVPLLALRLAIVALAAAALAQPVVLTGARVNAWNARTVRALVIDTSESMGPFASELRERAAAETRDAVGVARIETPDLAAGLRQAAAWLDASAPARREIVVMSDLQIGALDAASVAAVPASIGVRLVQVGAGEAERSYVAPELMSGERHEVTLAGTATTVKAVPGPRRHEGLRILVADSDRAAVGPLLRTLEAAGTPAPSPVEPIAIAFRGAGAPPGLETGITVAPWMRRVIASIITPDLKVGPTKTGELVVGVEEDLASLEAASIVRAVLVARAGAAARPEEEVLRTPAADVNAWSRAAPWVGREIARRADVSDARWAWLGVLLLLAAEAYVRRARVQPSESREHASAA